MEENFAPYELALELKGLGFDKKFFGSYLHFNKKLTIDPSNNAYLFDYGLFQLHFGNKLLIIYCIDYLSTDLFKMETSLL